MLVPWRPADSKLDDELTLTLKLGFQHLSTMVHSACIIPPIVILTAF